MRHFDKARLCDRLRSLEKQSRAAFAAACAERALTGFRTTWTNADRLDDFKEAMASLWTALQGGPPHFLLPLISQCRARIPNSAADSEVWGPEVVYAEDAAAAVTYALRAHQSSDLNDVVWAAERVYEALRKYAMELTGESGTSTASLARIDAHPLVQAELIRQEADLEEVRAGTISLQQLGSRARRDGRAFFAESR